MGCLASRRFDIYKEQQKAANDLMIEDIKQNEAQLPSNLQSNQFYACGYNFSLKNQKYADLPIESNKKIQNQNQQLTKQSLLAMFSELQVLYRFSRIQQCNLLIEKIKTVYHQKKESFKDTRENQQLQKYTELMQFIQEDYAYFKNNQNLLYQQWADIFNEDNGLYKYINNNQENILVVQSQLQFNASKFLINFSPFSKIKDALHFATQSKQTKRLSNFANIGQITFDFPFDQKYKQHYLLRIYDNLNLSKSIFICFQSFYNNFKLGHKFHFYPKAEEQKNIHLKRIICKIQPIEQNLIKIRMLLDFNISSKLLSEKLKLQLIKNYGKATLNKIMKQIKLSSQQKDINDGSTDENSKQVNQSDRDIYNYFNRRLKQSKLEHNKA